MAFAIGTALPFAFGFLALRRSMTRYGLLLISLIAITLCIVLTQSRGGILVWMAALGVYGYRRFGIRGVVFGALVALPMVFLGGRSGEEASKSSIERMEAWQTGLDLFRSDPVFGVGLGQFNEYHFLTAHNSYILAMSEMGFLGLVLFLALLYFSAKILLTGYQRYRRAHEARVAAHWNLAMIATIASTAIGILFLSLTYHPALWIYLGLSAALWQCIKTHDPEFRVRFQLLDWAVVLCASVAFIGLLYVYLRTKGV